MSRTGGPTIVSNSRRKEIPAVPDTARSGLGKLAGLEDLSSRLLYALTLLLALGLPFEMNQPLLVLPWFRFSNLEVLVWLTAVVWLGHLAVLGLRGRLRLTQAGWRSGAKLIGLALLFLGLATASALLAPAFRLEAAKFVTRFATGIYAFFLIIYTVNSPSRSRGLLWAIVAGAGLSALIAAGERAAWGPLEPVLRLFSPMPTHVGGDIRVNGTFVYTTIASMFFEMVIPLALALAASTTRRNLQLVSVIVAALCAAGVVLTLTRTGIITVAASFAMLFLLAVIRRPWRALALPTGVAALAFVGAMGLMALSTTSFATRLTTENDLNWFKATYSAPASATARAGDVLTLDVEVRNTGATTWLTDGDYPFALGYRWLSGDGQGQVGGGHTEVPLPHDVAPGQAVRVTVPVKVDLPPGTYQISWGMLQHNILWFRSRGVAEAKTVVEVSPGSPVAVVPQVPLIGPTRDDIVAPPAPVSRTQLWRVALKMVTERPLLGVGPDNFRHLYGDYLHLTRVDDRTHANNLYLEFLADLGVVGAASFWLLFLAILVRAISLFRTPPPGPLALLVIGLSVSLLAVLIHGVTDYFLEFASIYLLFWIALGSLVAVSRRGSWRLDETS